MNKIPCLFPHLLIASFLFLQADILAGVKNNAKYPQVAFAAEKLQDVLMEEG